MTLSKFHFEMALIAFEASLALATVLGVFVGSCVLITKAIKHCKKSYKQSRSGAINDVFG